MSRLNVIKNPEGKVSELFEMIKKKLGMVPNMMATLANSPAALEAYLSFSAALDHSSLSKTIREKIALVVGEENGCGYCVAAHTKLASLAGIDGATSIKARAGHGDNEKENAILSFSKKLVQSKAKVSDQDVAALKTVGLSEGEIAEIVAVVSLNIFTNYFNHVADPVIDFPKV